MRHLISLCVLVAAALTVTACTSTSAASESPGSILAAMSLIDTAGFHGMDTGLNGATPAIDASWLGKTRNARIASAAITWPEELQPQAKAFTDAAARLQAALENDDAAAAAAPAHDTHETQHDLSADAYAYLGTKAGIAPAKGGGH
jgi:hypothetical protein